MTDAFQVRVPRVSSSTAGDIAASSITTRGALPRPGGMPVSMSRGTSPEVALIGVYEISKILTAPRRLEVTLANVVNVLSSMLQMRHGMICILDSEGDPDMVATTGWTPEMAGQIRAHVPQKAIDQIVATQMPLVVQDVTADPLFAGHGICSALRRRPPSPSSACRSRPTIM